MKKSIYRNDGLLSGLSPSVGPFAIGSSSSVASKSEHDDPIWGDYTLDLSFLSSDDQRSGLDDDDSLSNLSRDVEITKEVLQNPNSLLTANTGVICEKSSRDEEEDTPCWIGKQSQRTTKSLTSGRSTDDLNGFYKLNPLAPQFIPSNAKKNHESGEDSSSSLKKSLSSTFPSSSGEFSPLEDGIDDAARTSIMTHNVDEKLGFVLEDNISTTLSMSDSRTELQPYKRLDPLAPVFVPSSAKISPFVNEKKKGALVKIAHPNSANNSIGSTSSYNPWVESKVEITEYPRSSNKGLNPLAPQFSLKPYGQPADGLFHGSSSFISPNADVIPSSSDSPSPKLDVKKLLTTMHGLSELLSLVHGSESPDSPTAEECDLVNNTLHNLNMYINNSFVPRNSYDLKFLPNTTKLSIKDFELPTANNMTVNLDVKRKGKQYSMVSGDSSLFEYGATKDNGFGQVVSKSGYQQNNYQGEEQSQQTSPHALFYKSLWLKAEAERCLMVYDTSLSNPYL